MARQLHLRRPRRLRTLPAALALLVLAACGSSSAARVAGGGPLPGDALDAADDGGAGEPLVLPGLRLLPPAGWEPRPPTSSFRKAQFELPGGRSGRPAELVVYHFGPGAGPVEANLERWCDQVLQPDGRPSREVAAIERRTIAGLSVHTIDVAGTYVAETSPGSGQRVNEPDHRLLGAIVESSAGPYYIKLVGRADVLERWAPSFERFLETLQPE